MTLTVLKIALNHTFKRYIQKTFRKYCSEFQTTLQKEREWIGVVGIEVHVQINSKSKLFSSSPAVFGSATNTKVSFFDAALPGTLPVLNKYCVDSAVKTALALNCEVHKSSSFDRKHYFYPDLPAGYQITQQFNPIASRGKVNFVVYEDGDPYIRTSYVKQLQLEQDSGRTFHVKGEKSFVDLNRAGIGLMELVFEPDLINGKEAAALVKELVLILKRIDTCSCEMEEGTLRIDANVSVRRSGEPMGIRTEVKNLNSLRSISRAVDFEIDRQIKVLERGETVRNETRTYDTRKKMTVFMRDKEVLQDYRFMPEPNLPPLCLHDDTIRSDENVTNINDVKNHMPILPHEQRVALMTKYKLTLKNADKILNHEGAQDKFEAIAYFVSDPSEICEFLFDTLIALLNVRQLSFRSCHLTAEQLAEILNLKISKTITEATACDILEMLFNGEERSAYDIVKEFNWYQINDKKELEGYCLRAMSARPKMVKKYRSSGKQRYMTSLLTFLYDITNNRAPYKESETMFKQLILKNEKK